MYRSDLIGVQVVKRLAPGSVRAREPTEEWFISIYVNGTPSESIGPLDTEMTLPDALAYVATRWRMEQGDHGK